MTGPDLSTREVIEKLDREVRNLQSIGWPFAHAIDRVARRHGIDPATKVRGLVVREREERAKLLAKIS